MDQPTALWTLQRRPAFRRSASVATAAYVATLLSSVLIALGSFDAPILVGIGGLAALLGLLWGGQAVHRVASNIDVAAEAVYAEYHSREAAE